MNLNFWSSCFYLLNLVITEKFHLTRILCSAGNQTQDFYLHSQPKAFSKVVVLGKLRQENHTSKVNLSQTLSLNKTFKNFFSHHFVPDSHFPHSVIKNQVLFYSLKSDDLRAPCLLLFWANSSRTRHALVCPWHIDRIILSDTIVALWYRFVISFC